MKTKCIDGGSHNFIFSDSRLEYPVGYSSSAMAQEVMYSTCTKCGTTIKSISNSIQPK